MIFTYGPQPQHERSNGITTIRTRLLPPSDQTQRVRDDTVMAKSSWREGESDDKLRRSSMHDTIRHTTSIAFQGLTFLQRLKNPAPFARNSALWE